MHGRAYIDANSATKSTGSCSWTFTVTSISKSGCTYDASANAITTATLACQ